MLETLHAQPRPIIIAGTLLLVVSLAAFAWVVRTLSAQEHERKRRVELLHK